MKKVIILSHSMQIGGIEKVLINFLKSMNYSEWDVSVIFLRTEGDYLTEIPSKTKILKDFSEFEWTKIFCYTWKTTLKKSLISLNFKGIISVFQYLCTRLFQNNYKENVYTVFLKDIDVIEEKYDLAIDFFGGGSISTFITANKIKATKKVTWVHSEDALKRMCKINYILKQYDKIFCVSQKCFMLINELLPQFKTKTDIYHNTIFSKDIIEKACGNPICFNKNNKVKILTVGRLSKEKGQFLALKTVFKLSKIKTNSKWEWYIIGDGEILFCLKILISILNLKDHFILLGYIENPYPYIKNCDIYVQPSRFEGFCTTITEANILKKTIIATNVSGVDEQITNGVTGIVIEYNTKQLLSSLYNLLENHDTRKIIEENKKLINYGYESEVFKLHSLLNDVKERDEFEIK